MGQFSPRRGTIGVIVIACESSPTKRLHVNCRDYIWCQEHKGNGSLPPTLICKPQPLSSLPSTLGSKSKFQHVLLPNFCLFTDFFSFFCFLANMKFLFCPYLILLQRRHVARLLSLSLSPERLPLLSLVSPGPPAVFCRRPSVTTRVFGEAKNTNFLKNFLQCVKHVNVRSNTSQTR